MEQLIIQYSFRNMNCQDNDSYNSVIQIYLEEDQEEHPQKQSAKQSQNLYKRIPKSSFNEDQLSGTFTALAQSFSDFNSSEREFTNTDRSNLKEKCIQQSRNYNQGQINRSSNKQNPDQIKINLEEYKCYLSCKQFNFKVDHQALQRLEDQFFRRQIFVPLFTFQTYDQWQLDSANNKSNHQNHSHKRFVTYFQRYVKYLNQQYPIQFYQILKHLTSNPSIKSPIKEETTWFASILRKNVQWVVENIKNLITTSKSLTLKHTLEAKIASMDQIKRNCQSNVYSKKIVDKIDKNLEVSWKHLAQVELLLSFEATEDYCLKNMQKSSSSKFKQIWSKYRQKMTTSKSQFQKTYLNELVV